MTDTGTIRPHPDNPHYFLFRGKPTVLVTSAEHYGAVINSDFDFLRYLDRLASFGLNYTRIYPGALFEREGDFIEENILAPSPGGLLLPWARSGTPGFALGGNKFDLDRWDDRYFARLREFVGQASRRGIVVEICFFNAQYPKNWSFQALHHTNNVQGVGVCDFLEFQTLKDAELVDRQEAYVSRITAEINGFDNVILEICDEPGLFGTPAIDYDRWISRLIDAVVRTERSLANTHLISQQMEGDLGGPGDFSSDARIGLVTGQYLQWETGKQMGGMLLLDTVYRKNKPIEINETAFYPVWYRGDREAAVRAEAWEFMVGGGAGFNNLNGYFTVKNPSGDSPENEKILVSFRALKDFLESFDLLTMTRDPASVQGWFPAGDSGRWPRRTQVLPENEIPVNAFCRCLSDPGKRYAFYMHHSAMDGGKYVVLSGRYRHELVFDIPAGRYTAEWIDPSDGKRLALETAVHPGGGLKFLTPVYGVDIALRLVNESAV